MDWENELIMALRVLGAVILGGLAGWEREWHGKEAGIRTYGAVALGACVFSLLSTHVSGGNNPHVIAACVVSGIGFLGAGVILHDRGNLVGLTTAATLWATASMGMAIGYGMYVLAVLVAVFVFVLLSAHHIPGWSKLKRQFDDPSSNADSRKDTLSKVE